MNMAAVRIVSRGSKCLVKLNSNSVIAQNVKIRKNNCFSTLISPCRYACTRNTAKHALGCKHAQSHRSCLAARVNNRDFVKVLNVAYCTESVSNEVLCARIENGVYVLSIAMPSRRETCRFVLKPVTNTLGDLVTHIRTEDNAINTVEAFTHDGETISHSTSIETLFHKDFELLINDQRYLVKSPTQGLNPPTNTVPNEADMKHLIARLYGTINSEQFYLAQQHYLLTRLEHLKAELEPMENTKKELLMKAAKRTELISWLGLGLMGIQLGFFARLTWWEYSWDIMEPVTYFTTCATSIAMFAYYVITKKKKVPTATLR